MSESERLRSQLKRLSLHTIAQIFEEEATKAARSEMSYTAFLCRLVDEEIAAKTDRSINTRISKARFPLLRTLEEFDFTFQPSLSAARIRELGELGFLSRAENIVFVGRPGVGKSHLSIGLALRACQARKRVLFLSAAELLEQLLAMEDYLLTSRTSSSMLTRDPEGNFVKSKRDVCGRVCIPSLGSRDRICLRASGSPACPRGRSLNRRQARPSALPSAGSVPGSHPPLSATARAQGRPASSSSRQRWLTPPEGIATQSGWPRNGRACLARC